jgi:hypothetical protein
MTDQTQEKEFKSHFKAWNEEQKQLRLLLGDPDRHDEAIDLFLHHHALLHAKRMAQTEPWTFEDAVLNDMDPGQIRRIPASEEHSVAWLLWHMARIEDVAMNTLVAGSPQILTFQNWLERLDAPLYHTGNNMDQQSVERLSATVAVGALRDYRVAVGRRTREIVQQLQADDLTQKVDLVRVQQVMDQGDLTEAASGIADYWGRRTIAGLLLMPATRHNMVHLNEAFRLKKRRG